MKNVSYDVVQPLIDPIFTKKEKPSKPIISIHTRDTRDTSKIIKTFYLKYPQFRWITFRDMRGLSEKEFSKALKECFMSVWIDDKSGHGTFPLESMACNVPCLGKIPDLSPEWMNEDNGVWVTDLTMMADYIADFIQNWLEDNIKPEMYEEMKKTAEKYSDKQEFENSVTTLFEKFLINRANSFEEQIIKIEE
jgi:glycosyltransferase involved in cell wall biosynthesis